MKLLDVTRHLPVLGPLSAGGPQLRTPVTVRTTPVPEHRWEPHGGAWRSLGLPRSLAVPVWTEYRGRATFSQPLPSVVPPPPRGLDGVRVLLLPGFGSTDLTLWPLGEWLASGGAQVFGSEQGPNLGCGEDVAQALTARLEELDGPVHLVGHSRGGLMGAVLAQRRPELVQSVVGLGAALADPFEVHLWVRGLAMSMAWLGRHGAPGLVTSCWRSGCCQVVHDDLLAPPVRPVTNVVGLLDGIVDGRVQDVPGVRVVRVRATHTGLLTEAASWYAVADALRRERERPPTREG